MKRLLSNSGSLTVEAVLIVPIIIFVMFWLVNITFVLYQYAALQSIANQAVESAQAGWDNPSKDIRTGRLESAAQLNDEELYWNVMDRDQSVKESSLKDWTNKQISQDRLMDIFTGKSKHGGIEVEVAIRRILGLRQNITVKITDNRSTLFSPIRSMFGLDMTNRVVVVSRGTFQDPAELIRDLDWGAELYSEYMNNNPDSALTDATRKLRDIRDKCINLLQ